MWEFHRICFADLIQWLQWFYKGHEVRYVISNQLLNSNYSKVPSSFLPDVSMSNWLQSAVIATKALPPKLST